ncbi:MAG: helix-hairpin-helix domain-containing protein [Gammaproteobacteria bacterium]|nr:helix-hairpin-helix domain-containing protein [Gammaproteobacteria bacterium]
MNSNNNAAMTKASAAATVNVNIANADQLKAVKGLDEKQAKAIVAYREKNGNFKAIDDLRKVPGIDDKVLAMIKPQITVGS